MARTGRPKSKLCKSKVIQLRVDPLLFDRVRGASYENLMSVPDFLRSVVVAAVSESERDAELGEV